MEGTARSRTLKRRKLGGVMYMHFIHTFCTHNHVHCISSIQSYPINTCTVFNLYFPPTIDPETAVMKHVKIEKH
jgi:hypothetical protein